MHSVGHTNELF